MSLITSHGDELDALAEYFGVNLELDEPRAQDPEAPMQWAVWILLPDTHDIIGSGETPGEAIAEARQTLLQWEGRK